MQRVKKIVRIKNS